MRRQTEDDDAALMERIARRRDGAALAMLVRRHQAMVRAVASRLVGASEAEDVAQEVFLRLWRTPPAFDPERGAFHVWLKRVTVNAAIDRLRRRTRRTTEPLDDEMADGESVDPETAAIASDRARRVRAAVAALPERQRLALTLAHDLGHGNGEIAEMLGVSVEAVESLLARARRTLRRTLAAEIAEMLEREKDAPLRRGEER
ncbi:MAG TPA: sigma-70 family RNA polymerase sigma factor [Thermopetrobacter sp.]|nr:sigma-70 family RNA polymerase sigma factor [Thermopetrobacter sp.]